MIESPRSERAIKRELWKIDFQRQRFEYVEREKAVTLIRSKSYFWAINTAARIVISVSRSMPLALRHDLICYGDPSMYFFPWQRD